MSFLTTVTIYCLDCDEELAVGVGEDFNFREVIQNHDCSEDEEE